MIDGNTNIADLIENYPEVVDFLTQEYGFYCVTCLASGFENLEQGARSHGIVGEDFEEMIGNVNLLINGELDYEFEY